MTRWKVLPRDQCQGARTNPDISPLVSLLITSLSGIRNFIVAFILQCSNTEEALRSQRTLLNKLNLVLISVLKQEWPHNWPTFINEIIQACHSSLSVAENNMIILRLLSEEVFDYSADQMTSAKTRNLKQTMCSEFSQIFQLCQEILNTATQPSLVLATLETLLRFCNWIPLGYIFETNLIELLRTRFLEVPEFRNITLQCLTEIGGLQTGTPGSNNYDEQLVKMFTEVLTTVSNIIPIQMDLKSTYSQSNSRDQQFISNLALFLTNFFSMHLGVSTFEVGTPICSPAKLMIADREPAKPRLPNPRPLLLDPHFSNRRPRNLQDYPRLLAQASAGALRRDAVSTHRRQSLDRNGQYVRGCTKSCAFDQLQLAQAQIRRDPHQPSSRHDREDGPS